MLVAVIRLSASKEAISKHHTIQWAEIVAYDMKEGANFDYKYRASGKMAMRLLTRADCFGMPEELDSNLSVGTRVAIIDLRVFVPEVISVLSTFSKHDFKDQMNQIPFFNRLIGQESTQTPLEYREGATIEERLSIALNNSEIDYVQRLSPSGKQQMIDEICSLKPIRSLYGTQLDAFAAALASATHCTQGPPGTGKSYIGVCLVLTLDVIRKQAEREGHAVGPVLVLSYKNHALDEFLIDVIHQSQFRPSPGMLIRTGKPDIESLLAYTEKHSPIERHAQERLGNVLNVRRQARKITKSWHDCARNLEAKSLFAV